jgi:hypothetical protein
MRVLSLMCALALLAAAAQGAEPDAAEYARLRLALAAGPGFDGNTLMLKELGIARQAKQEWAAGHAEETLARIRELLGFYPLSLLGNRMMAETCGQLASLTDDAEKQKELSALSAEHMARYSRLIESITGKSECTAQADHCRVITIEEENMVLLSLHLRKSRQALRAGDRPGLFYDVIDGTAADGSVKTLYFDISPFFGKDMPRN